MTLADWGNIGNLVSGAAALALALVAIGTGAASLKDWGAKQRRQAALAEEETRQIRLDRQRLLHGWTPAGVQVYGVTPVTEPAEFAQAQKELTTRGPSEYVVLRVSESAFNVNRAANLRDLIASGGYIARPPTAGEYEALTRGAALLFADDDGPPARRGRSAIARLLAKAWRR